MEGGVEVIGKEIFHEAQRKMQGLTDQNCSTEADSAPRGPEVAFVSGKQLSTVEWVNRHGKRFSLSSLEEWECLPELANLAQVRLNIYGREAVD